MALLQRSAFAPERLTRRALLGGLTLVGVGVLSACGGTGTGTGGTATTGGASSAPTTATVKMNDANKFDPADVTIAKGGTVTWQNVGSTQHTATDDPSLAANKADAQLPSGAQAWNSGLLNAGQSWSHTFDVAGTYKYFCIPHEALGMLGTVVVS